MALTPLPNIERVKGGSKSAFLKYSGVHKVSPINETLFELTYDQFFSRFFPLKALLQHN